MLYNELNDIFLKKRNFSIRGGRRWAGVSEGGRRVQRQQCTCSKQRLNQQVSASSLSPSPLWKKCAMNQTRVITRNLPATSQHVHFHTKPPEPPSPDALSPVSLSRLRANTFRQAWDQGGGVAIWAPCAARSGGTNTSYSQETAPTPSTPSPHPESPRARGLVVICVIPYLWLYSSLHL